VPVPEEDPDEEDELDVDFSDEPVLLEDDSEPFPGPESVEPLGVDSEDVLELEDPERDDDDPDRLSVL
jgi:hypothetical protein